MTSGTGVTGAGQWLEAQSTAVQMFISGSAASISQQKKGRARACGRRLFKVIVACRATFAPSLSLAACALGRVGVPRPGQLVRLNNNFIAYTHTHTLGHTYPHTHRHTQSPSEIAPIGFVCENWQHFFYFFYSASHKWSCKMQMKSRRRHRRRVKVHVRCDVAIKQD